mmetsp:Transcript_99086/g.275820  ORF Transcript_99086/g.275820 Transcript_99086/m.275820 type:complete len:98 (-) Transcript_99086:81-374(-)
MKVLCCVQVPTDKNNNAMQLHKPIEIQTLISEKWYTKRKRLTIKKNTNQGNTIAMTMSEKTLICRRPLPVNNGVDGPNSLAMLEMGLSKKGSRRSPT